VVRFVCLAYQKINNAMMGWFLLLKPTYKRVQWMCPCVYIIIQSLAAWFARGVRNCGGKMVRNISVDGRRAAAKN
jgi:hypothetical protein